MNNDTFLWGLKIADSLTTELISKMTVIAFGVGVICFICNMAYNYLYHGFSQLLNPDENKFPDYMEIARCIALFFCLSLYSPIAKTIVGTLEVINEATSLTSDRAQEFADYMAKSTTEQNEMLADYEKTSLQANIDADDDPDGALKKEVQNIEQDNIVSNVASGIDKIVQLLSPNNLVSLGIHSLATLFIGIVQIIVLGIGVVIVKILVILGPFTFAFSILPVFQKCLPKWFGTLCSMGMVFTVINVLNQIMWFTLKKIFDSGAFDLTDVATKQLQYLGMDLAMIGAYCCCFWLASLIVGHGDAGKIVSKTVALVTAATAMAIAGPGMVGKATNVGAAASLGKSIINDEE